jgi:hypothetical protein
MTKNMVQYHAKIDYEATIEKFQMLLSENLSFSFDVTGGRGRAGAQIVTHFKEWDLSINIYATGRIQIIYDTVPHLREGFKIIENCCVPLEGELFFECLGPVDPLDEAIEYTTIVNWQGTNLTYAEAKIDLYEWFDPNTGTYFYQLPDRRKQVKPVDQSYQFQGCFPIKMQCIDKDDANGKRVVTAEKLRWKMIKELKRIAREHSRVKFKDGRAFDVP